jgi:hypothetical protein
MARAFTGRHSGPVGSTDGANDNNIGDTRDGRTGPQEPSYIMMSAIVTGEDLVITLDPISGDWIVEDYGREAVLFTLPRECSLEEVRRTAAIYASAYKIGFQQGSTVARSISFLR